jgi:protein-S-isoprenylcysteine O-methyltransferase Ste14
MASPPRSYVLVALQIALMAALALPWRIAGWNAGGSALVAIGLLLGAWTLTANRIGNFGILPEPKSGARLVTSGPYRFVRHPMYLAVLIVAAGFAVGYSGTGQWRMEDLARALAWIGLAAVLHAKTGIEERELRARFPEYVAYARRAKRIVPFVL